MSPRVTKETIPHTNQDKQQPLDFTQLFKPRRLITQIFPWIRTNSHPLDIHGDHAEERIALESGAKINDIITGREYTISACIRMRLWVSLSPSRSARVRACVSFGARQSETNLKSRARARASSKEKIFTSVVTRLRLPTCLPAPPCDVCGTYGADRWFFPRAHGFSLFYALVGIVEASAALARDYWPVWAAGLVGLRGEWLERIVPRGCVSFFFPKFWFFYVAGWTIGCVAETSWLRGIDV